MELARLQDLFQRAVLNGEEAVLDEILDSPKECRDVLFGVYRDGYALRLIDAMQNDHEVLHAYLGDDAFESMARAYIAAWPSSNPNLRWFSKRLPTFLSTAEPYREHAEIGELAALEKALNDAFDAPDAPVVTIADLAGIAPEKWPAMRFIPHPSVIRLDMATNATAIWSALNNDEAPPERCVLGRRVSVLVWREDGIARFRELEEPEPMMWTEAEGGMPFGILCEMLATYDDRSDPAARAAGFLQGWIASGQLTAVRNDS